MTLLTLFQANLISATIVLAGAAVATTTATGTLVETVNLSGAAIASTSATGTLNGSVALYGAAVAITSAIGTLAGTNSLSGAAVATTTATASLVGPHNAPPNDLRTLQVSQWGAVGPLYRQVPDGIPIITHSPVAVLDYTFDWAARGWLAPGEVIVSQAVISDLGIAVPTVNPLPAAGAATAVQIWLSGGAIGVTYLITCQILTSYGRAAEAALYVKP